MSEDAGWSAASLGQRLVRRVGMRMLRSQYRRVEVAGVEHVPPTGPLVVVANHFTSLVDSLVLLEASPRPIAFLAKAPLWRSMILRPFLEMSEAVPVYRPEDAAEAGSHGARANLATFERCHERLAAGGAIALFPEGTTQAGPRLMPLRTGVARIALDLGRPVSIVPAGIIVAPSPTGGRETILVRFGPPLEVEGDEEGGRSRGAARRLTRAVEEALADRLLGVATLSEGEVLRLLRTVWDQERGATPARTLEEDHRRAQRFARALAKLERSDPEALAELEREAEKYLAGLESLGIPARMADRRYTAREVLRFLARDVPVMLLLTPLAVVAGVLTWPARALGDVLALRAFGGGRELRAFCRMAGSILLLAVASLAGALLGALLGGTLAAVGLLLLPWALYAVWVPWNDRQRAFRMRVRCFALLAGGRLRDTLRQQRRALLDRMQALQTRLP